jgi:hypothetical protein
MEKTKAQSNYASWYYNNLEKAREQKRISMRKLRSENPEKYNEQSRKAKVREKLKIYVMYGNSCSICGFSDMRALSLDHIKNDGNIERKEFGERGVYRKAKSEYRPDLYQILCMNCQFIKRAEHENHTDLNKEWQQQHSVY